MKRAFLVLLAILFFAAPSTVLAVAEERYIGPSGSASWANCTDSGTLCSLATANSTADAGDTVYMTAGVYTDTRLEPANSGTAGNYIFWTANGSDDATITPASGSGMYLTQDYIHVSGITFLNVPGSAAGGNQNRPCIYITGESNFLTNLWIENCLYDGYGAISFISALASVASIMLSAFLISAQSAPPSPNLLPIFPSICCSISGIYLNIWLCFMGLAMSPM